MPERARIIRGLLLLSAVSFSACGPSGLGGVKDLRMEVNRGMFLDESGRLLVTFFYDLREACLVGGDLSVTLNGRPLAVRQGERATGFFNAGDCLHPQAEGLPTAEDLAASDTVIEASEGELSIRSRMEAFFAPWTFIITEPSDGVLRPGMDAVISWSPSSHSVPEPLCPEACSPPLSFFYDAGFTRWRVEAAAITVSANTLRFRVPDTAATGSGELALGLSHVSPSVSECTGPAVCAASVIRDFSRYALSANVSH